MPSHYTLLDHTADLKFRVTGTDRADLFKNAGLALFELIADPDRLESGEGIVIDVTGDDPADLMVNYLRELLYLWTGNEKLGKMIKILQISDTAVSAHVSTVGYMPRPHEILHEIKAVTYHQIDVSRTADGWQAVVVFDV
jgi:SHS2 domain-containing protein